MTIALYGLSHKTAPLAVREQLAFSPNKLPQALTSLLNLEAVNEVLIVSTCNRTELYSNTATIKDNHLAQDFTQWIADFHQIPPHLFEPYHYVQTDQSATRHLMHVVSGLDSMVLGEPQILGQVKSAYNLARSQGTLGSRLSRLFETAFKTAKQVRTDTPIGVNTLSLAYAIVGLTKRIFSDIKQKKVLLIGTGQAIESVATYLKSQGVQTLYIAGRTPHQLSAFAQHFQAQALPIHDIIHYLPKCDVVVAATNCDLPILGKGTIESALKVRKHKPMLLVDLAVPRNIEPETSWLSDVFLYNIDDLKNLVQHNLASRQSAVTRAKAIIEVKVQNTMKALRTLEAAEFIRYYREQAQQIHKDELARAKLALSNQVAPDLVLEQLAHRLTRKLIHEPTTRLRDFASKDKDNDLNFNYLKSFFNLAHQPFIADDN